MTPPSPTALWVAGLAQNATTQFLVQPDTATMAAIAQTLNLSGLRKLRFEGTLQSHGAADWLLAGTLGATVTQPCVASLDPVTTRIDVPVRRHYQSDYIEPDAPEAEMPDDDAAEPLRQWIEPETVMIEALSLALPLYPRADGTPDLGETVVTAPGGAPLTADAMRPFAGLAGLRNRLKDEPDA